MNKRRMKKLFRKVDKLTGLSGEPCPLLYGPTPVLGRVEAELAGPLIQEVRKIKRGCFRQACIDVLGEDPEEDWK